MNHERATTRSAVSVEKFFVTLVTSWLFQSMESQRLEKIESHIAHLEHQLDQLNQVVIEQGRLLARVQKECAKLADTVETAELERIKGTNPKPPHYQ